MQATTFWKTVTMDQENLLEKVLEFLRQHHIRFCVIGGQAVNAYAEPLVSLDLDIVVAVDSMDELERLIRAHFVVHRLPHSLDISLPGSALRVQIWMDERYPSFVERAEIREVLGLKLPVAALEDVLQGKIWAASDPERRGSKRQKDLADIARLIEQYPHLKKLVPPEILGKLV
jgi:hypothetical protein